MKDITKYQGVIPAFYACYDAEGNISTESVKALTRHLIAKGVKGVYVGGEAMNRNTYPYRWTDTDQPLALWQAVEQISTSQHLNTTPPQHLNITTPQHLTITT
jgi:hypothetical protein